MSLSLIILCVSSVFTSILSAVTGMAGGIVLLSILTVFLPFSIIVPIHGLVQLASNSSRCWYLRKDINWRIFFAFLIGLPFGSGVAIYLIKSIDNKDIFLMMIAGVIFYSLFKPKKMPQLKIPQNCFVFIGFSIGVLGPLVGASGPFMAPFFIRDDLNKSQMVATKSSVQVLGHLIKIPTFLYLGFEYSEHFELTISLIIASLIGTKIGVTLLHKISEKLFLILFKVALFGAGLRILYKIVLS